MKPYKIFKNFLSEKECSDLNKWILDNKDESFFKDAGMNGKRVTTRYSENVPFPKYTLKMYQRCKIPNIAPLIIAHLCGFI